MNACTRSITASDTCLHIKPIYSKCTKINKQMSLKCLKECKDKDCIVECLEEYDTKETCNQIAKHNLTFKELCQ